MEYKPWQTWGGGRGNVFVIWCGVPGISASEWPYGYPGTEKPSLPPPPPPLPALPSRPPGLLPCATSEGIKLQRPIRKDSYVGGRGEVSKVLCPGPTHWLGRGIKPWKPVNPILPLPPPSPPPHPCMDWRIFLIPSLPPSLPLPVTRPPFPIVLPPSSRAQLCPNTTPFTPPQSSVFFYSATQGNRGAYSIQI